MPTKKPRITITFPDRQFELLDGIREVSGKPISRIVTELLEESVPVLEKMLALMTKLSGIAEADRLRIAKELERSHDKLEPVLLEAAGHWSSFCDRLEEIGDRDARSATSARTHGSTSAENARTAAATSPRPVITGAGKSGKTGGESRKAASDKAGRQVVRKRGS